METVNGRALAIEKQGTGEEAVVMVHGLGGTTNSFGPQAGPLGRFFTVVRFDLSGSGRSPLAGTLSIPGFADDVVGVMQANGIARAHLVGHSMGTVICQHVAARHPEMVASLVLMGPVAELPEPGRAAMRDRAAKARAEGMRVIADIMLGVAISAETRAHQPAVATLVRELLMGQDAEGYARTAEALADARAADLARIACPTLLLTGDEDGVAPPPAVRRLAWAIAGARLRVFAGCGHWTPLERPREVTEAMLEFYLDLRP